MFLLAPLSGKPGGLQAPGHSPANELTSNQYNRPKIRNVKYEI